MAEVGTAFVSVLPSAKGFGRSLDAQVGGDLDKSGKTSGRRWGNALKAGAIAVAGGAALATRFLGDAIGEAREAQKVGALTNSVIKATGGAAKVSAKQVGDLAGAISRKTGIDDETIQSGQNMILTFKNIRNEAGKGNDIFNQTSRTLVDMSAAMGTEPKQAAIQLGKALNDPIKGVSALSRVGVTFTEQQKKQIKTLVESGNVMGAQKIVLKELNSEFGGAAKSQATAGAKASVAMGNLKETIGTALLPVVDKLATVFTEKIAPAITTFVTGMKNGTGAGGTFVTIVRALGTGLASMAGFVKRNSDVIVPLVAGLAAGVLVMKAISLATKAWAAAQLILNVALTANPIGLLIAAIAALVVGLVVAYKKSETFRNIVNAAFAAIKKVVSTVLPAIKATIVTVFNAIKLYFTTVFRIYKTLFITAWKVIKTVTSAAFVGIKDLIIKPIGAVVDFIRGVPGKITALGSKFKAAGASIMNKMIEGIKNAAGFIGNIASSIWQGVKGLLNGAIDRINSALEFKIAIPGAPDIHVNPPNIPHLARGTKNFGGGVALVGEHGRELVALPRHSRVMPHGQTESMLRDASGGGVDYDALGEAVASALHNMGLTLKIGNSTAGRVVLAGQSVIERRH